MSDGDLLFEGLAPASGHIVFGDTGAPAETEPELVRPGDLVFEALAPASGNLVFGDDGEETPAPPTYIAVTGSFRRLRVAARLAPRADIQVTGSFRRLRVSASLQYRSNTSRPLVAQVRAPHGTLDRLEDGLAARHQEASALPAGWLSGHQAATHLQAAVNIVVPKTMQRTRTPIMVPSERATPLRNSVGARHQVANASARPSINAPHQAGTGLRQSVGIRHQDGTKTRRETASSAQRATPLGRWIVSRAGKGTPLSKGWMVPHQRAMQPLPGISILIKPTDPPPFSCYAPNGDLVFAAPWDGSGNLVFMCGDGSVPPPGPGATVVVPVRRVYMVVNSYSLRHVESDTMLQASNLRMSAGVNSWTWTWSATLRREALPLVRRAPGADPVEVEAMINGVPYRLRVEQVSRSKEFPATRVNVSGRGLAAVLASPSADEMTFGNTSLRTAQQLVNDVLTVNGVSLGWSVDWQLTDWSVPAGAWAFQGCYIDAVADIAAAAGGYVQPHPTAQTLRILPRYPAAPWDWTDLTPDLDLPADAAQLEDTAWIDKPDYNEVWVGGIGAGVFGPVTRAGTTGGRLAPQVNHALITHADAHRQRGLAVLADTGRQQQITLKMQLLPETGIVVPGKLVRYTGEDGPVLGLVRDVAVDGTGPLLRQTFTLEAHDV